MSKLSVNLYTHALRPQKQWLTLTNVGLVILVLLLLISLMRAQLMWQQHQLNSQRQTIEANTLLVQQQLAELGQRVREQRADAQLEQQIGRLERDILNLEALSVAVARSDSPAESHYGNLLADLSRIHQSGLWLQHIENRQGRLILRGQTERSSYLPQWMSQFQSVPSLAQKRFAVLALDNNDDGTLNFELRSQPMENDQ